MLKFNLKNIRQFRNCVNLLQCNQSTLAKSIKLDNDQQNNELNNLNKTQFSNKLNEIKQNNHFNLTNSNQLNNQIKLNHIKKLNSLNFNTSDKLLEKSNQESNKPTREQIDDFHVYVEDNFPKFFTERINLAYFDEFITIEDNQSGVTKKEFGFNNLVKKISFIRIYYSSMYSYNTMKVLSIAKIPDLGLVKLRWRISSRGRLWSFLQFWKVKNFKKKEFWNDGIVYFYLNKNGKVKRLVIEKVEKDEDENLAAKIAKPLSKIAKV